MHEVKSEIGVFADIIYCLTYSLSRVRSLDEKWTHLFVAPSIYVQFQFCIFYAHYIKYKEASHLE